MDTDMCHLMCPLASILAKPSLLSDPCSDMPFCQLGGQNRLGQDTAFTYDKHINTGIGDAGSILRTDIFILPPMV